MNKLVLITAGAFVLAAAAGAGGRAAAVRFLGGPTQAQEPAGEKGAPTSHAADSTHGPSSAPGQPMVSTPPPGVEPAALAAAASPHKAGVEFYEMTRVLAGLHPGDAAIFIHQLDDDRALNILRAMTVKDAAAILACLPAERRQDLKQRLLEARPGKP